MTVPSRRCLCSLLLMICTTAAVGASIGSPAPGFSLDDQYGKTLQLSSLLGKRVLVICGDRAGSAYMGAWVHGVGKNPDLTFVRVANLKGVPSLLHGFVRHKFEGNDSKGKPTVPVFLDWEGHIAHDYGFQNDLTNVYLIDASGLLRYTSAGTGTPEQIQRLAEAIKSLDLPAKISGCLHPPPCSLLAPPNSNS